MATGGRYVRAVPKFGEWEGNNNPNQAGFTVIFDKKRDEKRGNTGAPAAGKGDAPPSTFAPPPPLKPVSALAPPHLPKNETHCTIKPPNDAKHNQPPPVFAKPDPGYNNYNRPGPVYSNYNNRPDLSYNNHNNRPPVHDDNQNYPHQKRRWFCCG